MNAVMYDPFAWEVQQDPYPVYARLREHAPVYRNQERDFWALSRHGDVVAALRDPGRFSSRNGVQLEPSLWGPRARRTSWFLAMDPPEHTAARGLVSAAFTPRRVAALEPRIRDLARTRLEPLLSQPEPDFAAQFAAVLPMDVIAQMTGVPAADRDQVRAWASELTYREDLAGELGVRAAEAARCLAAYYAGLVADLRRRPGDDLTSALTQVRTDGASLSDADIIAFLFLLIGAGNESTGLLLTNAWYQGWASPGVQHAGLNGRAGDWAAETLRCDPSSQMMARLATEDIVLHQMLIPAGARVVLIPASANRDSRVFADPDRFDLDRDTAQTVAFGHGPHFCLGAALAQLEARVALEEIGAVISEYQLDADRARRVHHPHVRGFESLPCQLTLRTRRRG